MMRHELSLKFSCASGASGVGPLLDVPPIQSSFWYAQVVPSPIQQPWPWTPNCQVTEFALQAAAAQAALVFTEETRVKPPIWHVVLIGKRQFPPNGATRQPKSIGTTRRDDATVDKARSKIRWVVIILYRFFITVWWLRRKGREEKEKMRMKSDNKNKNNQSAVNARDNLQGGV